MYELATGMFKTVLRKRDGWIRLCLFLQIGAYATYYVVFASGRLWYLFLRKQFGWKQEEFITLKVVRKTLGIANLLLLVPYLKKLNLSDECLLIIFNILHAAGFLSAVLTGSSLVGLFLGVFLMTFHYPKYALARSLLSQTVDKKEVGRVFSCLALISALVPFFSHPLYGSIYDATLETFPGAFMFVTFGLISLAAVSMFMSKVLFKKVNVKDEEMEVEAADKLLSIDQSK